MALLEHCDLWTFDVLLFAESEGSSRIVHCDYCGNSCLALLHAQRGGIEKFIHGKYEDLGRTGSSNRLFVAKPSSAWNTWAPPEHNLPPEFRQWSIAFRNIGKRPVQDRLRKKPVAYRSPPLSLGLPGSKHAIPNHHPASLHSCHPKCNIQISGCMHKSATARSP